MKTTIDYKKSIAPKFDAVEDIRQHLGDRYDMVSKYMKTVTDVDQFAAACSISGIEGFPVIAWYDHFYGEGAYVKAYRAKYAEDV